MRSANHPLCEMFRLTAVKRSSLFGNKKGEAEASPLKSFCAES